MMAVRARLLSRILLAAEQADQLPVHVLLVARRARASSDDEYHHGVVVDVVHDAVLGAQGLDGQVSGEWLPSPGVISQGENGRHQSSASASVQPLQVGEYPPGDPDRIRPRSSSFL